MFPEISKNTSFITHIELSSPLYLNLAKAETSPEPLVSDWVAEECVCPEEAPVLRQSHHTVSHGSGALLLVILGEGTGNYSFIDLQKSSSESYLL